MSTEIHAVYSLSSARQIPLCWPFLSGPKPPRHERQSVCSVVAGGLYGPCRQLQMNHSPKKRKLWRGFFEQTCFFPPKRRYFPQQKKSKLLKDWVQNCFDFWFSAEKRFINEASLWRRAMPMRLDSVPVFEFEGDWVEESVRGDGGGGVVVVETERIMFQQSRF